MKNTSLEALKVHLFEALEGVKNLSDPTASENEKTTIEAARAVVEIADAIIDINKVQLDAVKLATKMDGLRQPGTVMHEMGMISQEQRSLIEM